MASIPPPLSLALAQGAPHIRRWWPAALALLLAAALHLTPVAWLQPLDVSGDPARAEIGSTAGDPAEQRGEDFPGAAYFFAEDAFAPIAPFGQTIDGVTDMSAGGSDPHILRLDSGPAALSMAINAATPLDQARALQCMTNAIYYEAGNEPEEGQRAVAQVILNRVASGRWPSSVCGVVYQGGERADRGCQFTFSCDGSMARTPVPSLWARARSVAARALGGEVFAPAGLATFYHTLAVHPGWSELVKPVAVIGAHIFYRLPGNAGAAGAYAMRYSGREFAQPGPYAFVKPLKPIDLSPPGPPASWILPGGTTMLASPASGSAPAGSTTAPVIAASPGQAVPSIAPTFQQDIPVAPTSSPAHGRAEPGLPESSVRPEYRNSGKPLS